MVFQKYNDFVVFPMHIFAVYLLNQILYKILRKSIGNQLNPYQILKKPKDFVKNLMDFYSRDNNLDRILPIINGKSNISLRLIKILAEKFINSSAPRKLVRACINKYFSFIDQNLLISTKSINTCGKAGKNIANLLQIQSGKNPNIFSKIPVKVDNPGITEASAFTTNSMVSFIAVHPNCKPELITETPKGDPKDAK